MQQTKTETGDQQSDNQPAFQNYIPGMPRASNEAGPVERFLTRLFRPRGEYRVRVRRD
jgi:hypothetical protein